MWLIFNLLFRHKVIGQEVIFLQIYFNLEVLFSCCRLLLLLLRCLVF
jgi:hypothetical protein